LVTTAYYGKTTKTIEVPFWVIYQKEPRNHVLDAGQDTSREGIKFGGIDAAQYYG